MKLRDDGLTFKQIANTLNERGVKPPRAKQFTKANVQMSYYAILDRMNRVSDKGVRKRYRMKVEKG